MASYFRKRVSSCFVFLFVRLFCFVRSLTYPNSSPLTSQSSLPAFLSLNYSCTCVLRSLFQFLPWLIEIFPNSYLNPFFIYSPPRFHLKGSSHERLFRLLRIITNGLFSETPDLRCAAFVSISDLRSLNLDIVPIPF